MMHVLFVFVELKLLEVQPVPENLTVLDLSWYEDYEYLTVLFTSLRACSQLGTDCICFIKGTSWDVFLTGCARAADWRCWTSTIIL